MTHAKVKDSWIAAGRQTRAGAGPDLVGSHDVSARVDAVELARAVRKPEGRERRLAVDESVVEAREAHIDSDNVPLRAARKGECSLLVGCAGLWIIYGPQLPVVADKAMVDVP